MAKPTETDEARKQREMAETMAQEISKLSRQVSALLDGRLSRQAVVLLLVASTRLPHRHVDIMLDAITGLEKKYLK